METFLHNAFSWVQYFWDQLQLNWAGIVATSAVVITVQQYFQQRRHDKLSVKPNIEFALSVGDKGVDFSILNTGVGPALVRGLYPTVRGVELQEFWTWRQLLDSLFPVTDGDGQVSAVLVVVQTIPKWVGSGEEHLICTFSSDPRVDPKSLMRQFALHVQFSAPFASIYEGKGWVGLFDARRNFPNAD